MSVRVVSSGTNEAAWVVSSSRWTEPRDLHVNAHSTRQTMSVDVTPLDRNAY